MERRLEEPDQLAQLSPLITQIKADTNVEEAAKVLEEAYHALKSEHCYQHLARLYMTEGNLVKALRYAQQAVTLSPKKREFRHTLGLVYLKMFTAPSKKAKDCIPKLQTAFLALQNFISAQGREDDDAYNVNFFAYTGSIDTINQILTFVVKELRPEDVYRFGRYLTDPAANFPMFDEQPDFRETFKSLIEQGLKELRFLHFLCYSHWFGFGSRSFHSRIDANRLTYVQEHLVRAFNIFARMLRTVHKFDVYSQDITEEVANNAYRIENIKLKGCFFESIFEMYKDCKTTGPKGRKRRADLCPKLCTMRDNLCKITAKTSFDRENLMSASLALELMGYENAFTDKASDLYKMCLEIFSDKHADATTKAKAHMYLLLLSWPNVRRPVFNHEQFRNSFQKNHALSPLIFNRHQTLSSNVHFFILRRGSPHYLCHWTEIFGDNANREAALEMSEKCETFSGVYKVVKKQDGGKTQHIDMSWQSAMGELNLKIYRVRGLKVFRKEKVHFHLAFSVYGPEAYIKSIIPSDDADKSASEEP
jgi:tetratricopeptide (TPR) repeat protein